jgi:hypothetical protein
MDPKVDALDERNGDHRTSSIDDATVAKITKTSSIIMVLISGLALFSDGYNAQIIGYMNPLFKQLYPDAFTPMIKTRLSNAYLIGEIFGMCESKPIPLQLCYTNLELVSIFWIPDR